MNYNNDYNKQFCCTATIWNMKQMKLRSSRKLHLNVWALWVHCECIVTHQPQATNPINNNDAWNVNQLWIFVKLNLSYMLVMLDFSQPHAAERSHNSIKSPLQNSIMCDTYCPCFTHIYQRAGYAEASSSTSKANPIPNTVLLIA